MRVDETKICPFCEKRTAAITQVCPRCKGDLNSIALIQEEGALYGISIKGEVLAHGLAWERAKSLASILSRSGIK